MSIFTNGLIKENPLLILNIGLCSSLGITTSIFNGLGMGMGMTFVLVMSELVISIFRKHIPSAIRLPVFIVIMIGREGAIGAEELGGGIVRGRPGPLLIIHVLQVILLPIFPLHMEVSLPIGYALLGHMEDHGAMINGAICFILIIGNDFQHFPYPLK